MDSNETTSIKRSVVNWTEKQYDDLNKASAALGLSVPQFCKTAALEKGRIVNGRDG